MDTFISKNYHFKRLFSGLATLAFDIPVHISPSWLSSQIQSLCLLNQHASARVRLTAFRQQGILRLPESPFPNFVIETTPLFELPTIHLSTTLYDRDTKSMGLLSNLKSNNYLLYAMAAMYAEGMKTDECFVINQQGRICEASTSNVFVVKKQILYTPALSEGCVAGVMRRHLLALLPPLDIEIVQTEITRKDVEQADEIFLTNALYPVRSVANFEKTHYGNALTLQLRNYIK